MMATVRRSQHIEGVAAPHLESMSTAAFYREVLGWVGDMANGLRVEVIRSGGRDVVEVFGWLPSALRVHLRRAYANWERPRRGWVAWKDVPIVWHTTAHGYGPRFAISGLGALIDLVAERHLALQTEAA